MEFRLNREAKRIIRDRYAMHPLYGAINRCCKHYESEMEWFAFSPEEVFLEVLRFVERARMNDASPLLLETLWDDMYGEFRDFGTSADRDEIKKAISIVLYIVVAVLLMSDNDKYKDCYCIEIIMMIHSNYAGWEELESRLLTEFSNHADDVKTWIDGYLYNETSLVHEAEELVYPVIGDRGDGEHQAARILRSSTKTPGAGAEDFGIFNHQIDTKCINLSKLKNFIKSEFLPFLKYQYEWFALYMFLYDEKFLAEKDVSRFAEQMNLDGWFPDAKKKCTGDSINDYSFLANVDRGEWKYSFHIPQGSKARQRGCTNLYKRYECLKENFRIDDILD